LSTAKSVLRSKLLSKIAHDDSPLAGTHQRLEDHDLVATVTNFIASYPTFSKKLFNVSGQVDGFGHGIGRGELLVYFIYDNVTLGASTSSIDVHVSGIPYVEVKCARKRQDVWADFRLGTDEWTASHHLLGHVVSQVIRLDSKAKLIAPENLGNIPKSMLDEMRRLSPKSMKAAEEAYYDKLFSGRIGSKRFLFFDSDTRLPIYYGKLSREQLFLERFSAGQAKLLFNPLADLHQPPPSGIIRSDGTINTASTAAPSTTGPDRLSP
jgi:hypothetical protein